MQPLSFTGTRQVRFPAPDVTRGFMLALIALANVAFWVRYFPDAPRAGVETLAVMGEADQWWYLLRTLFVDRRAYPLFSILFGFGMAIMASRTIERERRRAWDGVCVEQSGAWTPLQRQFFTENVERRARRAASRLIRRRGAWMLAFGAVHSVVFSGDIIGTYGLVAVIFAEVVVMRAAWARVIVATVFSVLAVLGLMAVGATIGGAPMTLEHQVPATVHMTYPITSMAQWVFGTLATVLLALVVPCVMIGVAVARSRILEDPRGHWLLLAALAGAGLGVGAIGALPYALMELRWAVVGDAWWLYPLFHVSGVAGACGWLALLALVGGGPREKVGTFCSFLSAVGRRSMTAYLSQTLLFVVVFAVVGALGVRRVGEAVAALVALGVWALIGLGCAVAEACGTSRGPAEWALRWLVAWSARPLPKPTVPSPVAANQVLDSRNDVRSSHE